MFSQEDFKPAVILLYTVAAASLWKYFSLETANIFLAEYKIIAAFILFGLVPMGIVKGVFRESLADYGLRIGNRLHTCRSFLILVPFVALTAYGTGLTQTFTDVYPFNELMQVRYIARQTGLEPQISYSFFAVHCLLYLGYYFAWEFLFRGFIQHGLSQRCGLPTAVCVQTLASVMLHYGHPGSEVFGALAAGLVLGWLAQRTQSLLSGLGLHAVLGIVLDVTLVYG